MPGLEDTKFELTGTRRFTGGQEIERKFDVLGFPNRHLSWDELNAPRDENGEIIAQAAVEDEVVADEVVENTPVVAPEEAAGEPAVEVPPADEATPPVAAAEAPVEAATATTTETTAVVEVVEAPVVEANPVA